jgi:hypothetical protein
MRIVVCPFSTKAHTAIAAGYSALVVINGRSQPPLQQFGFGDLDSSNPLTLPVIAVEESDLSVSALNALRRSPSSKEGRAALRLHITFSTLVIIQSFLNSANSHLTIWKSRRQVDAESASYILQRSLACAVEAEKLLSENDCSSETKPSGGVSSLCSSAAAAAAAEVHFFLGNLNHFHLSPVRPDKAYEHYRRATALSREKGEEHLPALTNAAALMYKHFVIAPNTPPGILAAAEGGSAGSWKDISPIARQEIEFLELKLRAQLEVARRYARRVQRALEERTGGVYNFTVAASLVFDWGEQVRDGGRELEIFSLTCDNTTDNVFCLLPTGNCNATSYEFSLADGSCVFGQPSPHGRSQDRSSSPPLHLSPRGRIDDPEHDHMFYLDRATHTASSSASSSGGVYLNVFHDAVVSGAVGVPVTYGLSEGSTGNDWQVLLKIWLPSPGVFVPLHTLLDSDSDDGVGDRQEGGEEGVVTGVVRLVRSAEMARDKAKVGKNGIPSVESLGTDLSRLQLTRDRFEVTLNGIQTSCNNYYHWATQCFPRVMMALELLVGSDVTTSPRNNFSLPSQPQDSISIGITVDVYILVPAGLDENQVDTRPLPFVAESLALANLRNGSVYHSTAHPSMWATLLGRHDAAAVPGAVFDLVWVRMLLVDHHVYRTYPVTTLLQVEWGHSTNTVVLGRRGNYGEWLPKSTSDGNSNSNSNSDSDGRESAAAGVTGQRRSVDAVLQTLAAGAAHASKAYGQCAPFRVNASMCNQMWAHDGMCGSSLSSPDTSLLCRCCVLASVLTGREGLEFAVPRRVVRFLRSEGKLFSSSSCSSSSSSSSSSSWTDAVTTSAMAAEEVTDVHGGHSIPRDGLSAGEGIRGLAAGAISSCIWRGGDVSGAEEEEEEVQYVLYVSRANGAAVGGRVKEATRVVRNEAEVIRTLLRDLETLDLLEASRGGGEGGEKRRGRRRELVVVYADGECKRKRTRRQLEQQNASLTVNNRLDRGVSSGNNGKSGNICQCLPHDKDHMETHRVERDRELFGRAAVVVGVHGAALTNILFARPGTAVVEIVLDTTRHRDFM